MSYLAAFEYVLIILDDDLFILYNQYSCCNDLEG